VVIDEIEKTDVFLLLWTTHSARSPVVTEELLCALKNKRRIIPVCADDEELTPLLAGIHYIRWKPTDMDLTSILKDLGLHEENVKPNRDGAAEAIRSLRSVVAEKFGYLDILTLGNKEAIEDAYVELYLVPGLRLTSITIGSTTPSRLFAELPQADDNVVLAGDPGTGKTSTLQFMMYRWSISDRTEVPIYARLKAYKRRLYDRFDDFLREQFYLTQPLALRKSFETVNLFEELHTVLLLDGLDEVPIGSYESFRDQLNQHLATYPRTRVILTTRLEGYRDGRENDFLTWRTLSIAPLDNTQIQHFVARAFPHERDQKAFLEQLSRPRLRELANRAFLLTLMTIVFRDGQTIGPNRSALYEQSTAYLERSRSSALPEAQREKRNIILRETALRFLQLDAKELNERVISAHIDALAGFHVTDSTDFLEQLANDTGLLQRHGDTYGFIHKSFQEYYAALALREMVNGRELLLAYCTVPQWEEPVRLFAGSLQARSAQEDLIEQLWERNPALALRTATECTHLAPAFLRRLIHRSEPDERVQMIETVRRSLQELDAEEAKRTTTETLAPLFDYETDSAVLYFGLRLLSEFDPTDSGGLRQKTFEASAAVLRQELAADPRYCWEFVEIPPGSFRMGDDQAQDEMERPSHLVTVDGYRISRFQVTNLAFEKIMGMEASRRNEYSHDDREPVVNVSWYDAYICAVRVGVRLPTEAEWEHAARAGGTGQYCFGDDVKLLSEYANYEDSLIRRTWPVGTGKPNEWGLYDVHGNAWEWCQDWLAPYSPGAQHNPKGPPVGTMRVRRGGGHAYHARGCRSAFRWGNDPLYRFRDIGIRLAADLV
jgi:formylglycine-generating enzyme required for sulfatase activity